MRVSKALLFAFVMTGLTTAAEAEVIRVVPLEVNDSAVFSCGDRCKFRGTVGPDERLRVRIIRGTISELVAMTTDRRYASAGCIELNSIVVRPRRSRRATDLLDLAFYFTDRWLGAGGRNGQYVFVVERDDRDEGPAFDKTSTLRLPVGRQGARYFEAGLDVAVRAPVNVRGSGGFLAWLFGSTSRPEPTRAPTASMGGGPRATASRDGGSSPAETMADVSLPPSAPRAMVVPNCIDVQVEPEPILFRRADASTVVRIAVK